MDDEDKKEITRICAEMQAMRLVVNEALAVALSHEADPDKSASHARLDLTKVLDETERRAKEGPNAEYRLWFCGLVRNSLDALLDAIEKRVSQLKLGRTAH